ncbi:PTS sugar transporter subunit IIA [candidate division WOR-3 bacterium]|nr:PTS sugar transporter subunit IIA [candidate division WOR-3 bacterium]
MLADYLGEGNILLNFDERSYRQALLKMLSKSVERNNLQIVDKILERENIMSTAMGKGVFLPRVIVTDKSKSEVIIAVNPNGLSFEDYGTSTANIIMLFLFSKNNDYAAILAQSLRMLNDDSLRADLLESRNAGDVIKAIREWEEE